MKIRVYIEGGDDDGQRRRLRAGFGAFFESAGLKGRMPQLIACGDKNDTYSKFLGAVSNYPTETCLLLVDSDGDVAADAGSLQYLKSKNGWIRLEASHHVYLMVHCMEAWIVADREAVQGYFGVSLPNAFPSDHVQIERIPAKDLERHLKQVARSSVKKDYVKSRDGAELMKRLKAETIENRCPHAKSLLEFLRENLR